MASHLYENYREWDYPDVCDLEDVSTIEYPTN